MPSSPGLYKREHNAARGSLEGSIGGRRRELKSESSCSGEPVEGEEGEPDGGSADGARSTDGGRSSELVQSGAVSVGQSRETELAADGERQTGADRRRGRSSKRVAEWSRDAEEGSGAGQRAEWRPPPEKGRRPQPGGVCRSQCGPERQLVGRSVSNSPLPYRASR